MSKNKCSVNNCPNNSRSKNLCKKHYSKYLRYGDPLASSGRYFSTTGKCSVSGCDKKHKAKGFCNYHYERATISGKLDSNRDRCIVSKCNNFIHGNKMCESHYKITYKFGITPQEYSEIFERQMGVCAICKKECSLGRRLAIDHDHDTGMIRGLLCSSCNTSLGKFNDDPNLLRSAIEYLKQWGKYES